MHNKLTLATLIPIGFMLFSSFFGAGNVIFPPLFGYLAGSNIGIATLAFCITGVGLPLLGVIAMAMKGTDDINALASPVSPTYAKVVLFISALTIGPCFAIPRTAAVSYEIGLMPMFGSEPTTWGLALYSLLYFLLSLHVANNPSKVVDWLGKYLTPMLLACLAVLAVAVLYGASGTVSTPQAEYVTNPFYKGFLEGYNTMDLLASFLFGASAITAIKLHGITEKASITRACLAAGAIAGICLMLIYAFLAYAGADSVNYMTGKVTNGGQILMLCTQHYLGKVGLVILGLIIILACLTTCIGLIAAVAHYFRGMFPFAITETRYAMGIATFGFLASNVGLTNIIQLAVPVLCFLYPTLCTVTLLNIAGPLYNFSPLVFRTSIIPVTIIAIADGVKAAGFSLPWEQILNSYLPLYSAGFGWFTVAVIGALSGFILSKFR